MQEIWKWGNLTLAFAMEVAALVVLGVWGWKIPEATAGKVVLAIAMPLVAAIVWGLFAAPQARFDSAALAILTKIVVFGAAAIGLWAMGSRVLAVVFVVVLGANLLAIKMGHLNA